MAWEWSHTPEAYQDAERNLRDLETLELRVIYCEWQAYEPDGYYGDDGYHGDDFDQEAYDEAMDEALKMSHDDLADYIWRKASDQATCDNGGFNAWTCPYGCGCHTVPFDRQAVAS